jgi:hypothetical protein
MIPGIWDLPELADNDSGDSPIRLAREAELLSTNALWPRSFKGLLVALAASVFVVSIDLFSLIPNRVGPFELISIVLIGAWVVFSTIHQYAFLWHPLHLVVGLIALAAFISVLQARIGAVDVWSPDRLTASLVGVVVLFYFLALLIVLYNLMMFDPANLSLLVRAITYATIPAILWVIADQFLHPQWPMPVYALGPFRFLRALMGSYMFSLFWIIMVNLFWPGRPRWDRVASVVALFLAAYAVAVAGRRSVFLAMAVGLVGIMVALPFISGKERARILGLFGALGFILLSFYLIGSRFVPQFFFFQHKVDELLTFVEAKRFGQTSEEDGFLFGQHEGALQAFMDHPLLGIGWGGFYRSAYSPTGHELHGTPQKFLAELGLVGFLLYMVFMGYLFIRSGYLFLCLRKTPWRMPALLLAIALWSGPISFLYNRQMTDRAFWLLLAIFIGFEAFMRLSHDRASMVWSRKQTV